MNDPRAPSPLASPARVFAGLVLGLGAGAVMLDAALTLYAWRWNPTPSSWPSPISQLTLTLTAYCTFFLGGSFILSGLVWIPLHSRGHRGWLTALAVGFGTTFLTGGAVGFLWAGAIGFESLASIAVFDAIGAIAWLVVWALAYR